MRILAITKKKTKDVWRRKEWFEIIAPKIFDSQTAGETVAEKDSLLFKRTIKTPAGEIYGRARRANIDLIFKINRIEGKKAITKLVGHEISRSFLQRFIKKRTTKVEVIQNIEDRERNKVKIKTVVVTATNANQKQVKEIRKRVCEIVREFLIKNSLEEFVKNGVLDQEVVFKIKERVKKIIPLRVVLVEKSRLVEK